METTANRKNSANDEEVKDGLIMGIENLNQMTQLADSPKLYGNENIIS